MNKNTLRLSIVGCAMTALLLVLPLRAQDDWPEGCQLPDLEEAMNAASEAQADGDVAAFVDSMSEINQSVASALEDCLEAAVENDVDLAGANLRNANLQGADLTGANLEETDLSEADLQGANLTTACLQRAGLHTANLQGANLSLANLEGADLTRANLEDTNLHRGQLRGADLTDANLQGANLAYASLEGASGEMVDLRGAVLHRAHLLGADLIDAIFDETTALPDDGFWTPDTDITRFTDPAHPDFWEPCVESAGLPWYCEDSGD